MQAHPPCGLAVATIALLLTGCSSGRPAGVSMPAEQTDSCVVGTTQELPDAVSALDRTKEAEWGLLPYATLAKDRELARRTTLLFLTEPAYEAAVAGLDDAQIAEVVRKRLADPPAYLVVMVEAQGERAGELAAQAAAARQAVKTAKGRASWDEPVAAALAAQQVSYRTGRIVDYDADQVDTAIQWRASLLAAERELAARKDVTRQMKTAANSAVAAYAETFADLAAVLAGLGDPTYTELPARDVSERIVLVEQNHPLVAPQVERQILPADPWNDRWLVPLAPEQLAAVNKLGDPLVMYLSVAEFMTASRLLTDAQFDRDLRQRVASRGPTPLQYLQHLVTLRLDLIAHLGVLIEIGRETKPSPTDSLQRLEAARDRELQLVAPLLDGLPRWKGASGRLPEALEELRTQLRITQAFAAAAGAAAAGASELDECVSRMRQSIDRIKLPRLPTR